ncbi:glycosyltransferase family 2 protein [Pedobacter aquatilis]|uniref:glycosyltransferase family 2 protein n=1 Tax=Pedobacter aquatilis TaxID=351343 RepID=UPI00292E6163|nr:glycosyltransferase family 2 protein [Pedobacter aquatilis]
MKVTGFTFIRNAIANDYPVREAILSVLSLCDDFVVALGNSTDETSALVKSINPEKIRTIDTIWDDNLKEGGFVFADETNKALAGVDKDADWLIYIQGDEAIHEDYLPIIKKEMEAELNNDKVEALLLKYKHFYASYDYLAESRRWYRREVRILKNLPSIHSYRDAQGFRINDRKLKVKLIDAYVFHYGWVKPPKGLQGKVRNFNQYYQTEEWIEQHYPVQGSFDMHNADRLVHFKGTHPAVLKPRIEAANWKFEQDLTKQTPKMNFRRRFLQKIEDLTGLRLFEYRNYKIVK